MQEMPNNFYNYVKKIDTLLESFSINSFNKLMELIQTKSLKAFKKISEIDNPLPWLRPLYEKDFFNPSNNPKPKETDKNSYSIPYWPVLFYLENAVKKVDEDKDGSIIELIIKIINNIAEYKEDGKRIDNDRTGWMLVKILAQLPNEHIQEIHFSYIRTFLETQWSGSLVASEIEKFLMPKFIKSNDKQRILWLLDVVLDFKEPDKKNSYKYEPLMEGYWLNELLKKNVIEIAEICSTDALHIALTKVDEILKEKAFLFSDSFVNSIEDRAGNIFKEDYQYILVHFIRDIIKGISQDKRMDILEKLLAKDAPIYKRIVFHTINTHYNEIKTLFWDWKGNPLETPSAKNELYQLLKNHCREFEAREIKQVIDWIKHKEYKFNEDKELDNADKERLKALWKKEWVHALLETDNADVKALYNEYDTINSTELKSPGFDHYTESRVGYRMPDDIDEKLNLPIPEIIVYINEFPDGDDWNTPSKNDLADALQKKVSNEPERFSEEINKFSDIDDLYLYHIFVGLHEAWHKGISFNWKSVLEFILSFIKEPSFWEEYSNPEHKSYPNWIVGQFARLIEEGTNNDEHAFKPDLLPLAEEILLILVVKVPTEIGDKAVLGVLNDVLNSNKGKVLEAIVKYALRCARLENKKEGPRWKPEIKDVFEERLSREKDPSIEYSTIMGQYIANIFYLDKEWANSNFNKIFPIENKEHWLAAIQGYLLHSSKVFEEIYSLMKEYGHYRKILTGDFDNSLLNQRIAGHVCIGYLLGWDKIEDESSLISLLLNNGNVEQLSEMVTFIWRHGVEQEKKIFSTIKPLWKTTCNVIIEKQSLPEYQKLASHLPLWINLIDDLDKDIVTWLMLSAKYIGHSYESYEFIQALAKYADKHTNSVGQILLVIAKNEPNPGMRQEPINKIIATLYTNELNELADRICNVYGERGAYFLRKLYEENKGESE